MRTKQLDEAICQSKTEARETGSRFIERTENSDCRRIGNARRVALEYLGLVFRDNDDSEEEEDPKRKLISACKLPRNKTYVLNFPPTLITELSGNEAGEPRSFES